MCIRDSLIRIGGDSRARYCYCQDYALPMWMFVSDAFGEDCSGLMRGWMEILHKEIKCNGDGSFLSERAGYLEEHSLIYYTRLERDRAVVLSMLQYLSLIHIFPRMIPPHQYKHLRMSRCMMSS